MKKPGEFLKTKAKHKAKAQNQEKLKDLREGCDVEILAFDDESIKNFKVSIVKPSLKSLEKLKVLCLFGKGESRHLRIMEQLEEKENSIHVKNELHEAWIPIEQRFGYSYGEILPEAKCIGCVKQAKKDFSPFCSQQCKVIDLGSWVSGAYKVSIDTEDEYSDSVPSGNDD